MPDDRSYRLFFYALPLPALILRPENSGFLIVDTNDAFSKLLSLKKEDVNEKYLKEAFPINPVQQDSGHKVLSAFLKRAIETGKSIRLKETRYDLPVQGTSHFIEKYWTSEIVPIKDDEGRTEHILLTTDDVTLEVLSQKKERNFHLEIDRLSDRYSHFIEGNPDALYSLDCEGNFLAINEGTARLTEVPREQLLQMNFESFCDPGDSDKIWAHFWKALEGEPTQFEANFLSGSGKKLVLSISLVPMDTGGKIKGVYGIAKDVTSVRTSEKTILEKKKFLEVNASFIKTLLDNELEDKTLEEAFAIIAKTIDVDRMYYFGTDKNQNSGETYISQRVEWTNSRATPQIDNPEMQNMPASRVKKIMGPLNKNLPFIGRISELEEGDLKKLFLEQGIKSMLLLPIFLKNELFGFIGFDDCTRERVWTIDEIDFLQSLAHYFTSSLEKKSAETTALQKEEELKKSEEKFKALVQEGSDLLAIVDINGNFKFVSNTATRVTGAPPEKLVGTNAFSFVHPEDKESLQKELTHLAVKRHKKSSPYRVKDHLGNWRWIETTATNLIKNPAVGGIVLNSRDITTIVEQAREIEQINERYQLAAAATNDLIYDWDLTNDQITRFYSGAKDHFGYSEKELDGQDFWLENVHPEEREKEIEKLNQALRDKNRNTIKTEYRFKRADGTYAKVTDRGYILRNGEGRALRIIGATSDVSDLLEKEEALTLANTRFEMAMKATDEIIWDWDLKNDLVTRSVTFEKNYGYESTVPVEPFWFQKVLEKDRQRVRNSLMSALKDLTQTKWREEYCLQKASGEQAHVIDRGYIVRDRNGRATRVVGAILDVTESRRLIKEIRRQNEGLREIAWKQSHEVRAPLARLKGLVDLLKSKDLDDLDRDEILGHIFCSADELDRIIREIVEKTEHIEISHKEGDIESQNSGPVDVV